jgi:DNA-binding MarR family transcriptional regulator
VRNPESHYAVMNALWYVPRTARELVEETGLPYATVLRALHRAERRGAVCHLAMPHVTRTYLWWVPLSYRRVELV